MSKRKIEFWAHPDCSDRLEHQSLDDAIEAYLEGLPIEWLRVLFERRWDVEIYGYARVAFKVDPVGLVDNEYERLEEEFGDPDRLDRRYPSAHVRELAAQLANAIEQDYTPWACESVACSRVSVPEWIEKHRPGWMREIWP